MNSGLSPGDPTLVAAFRSALLHQGAIAVLMLAFLWLLWATARTWRPAASSAMSRAAIAEPRGRWLLRIGFGVLWIFDGILQAQPKMAGGAASSTWRPLPPVPAGTQVLAPPGTGTLAPGTGGSYDALAVAGSRLTVWRLAQGAWAAGHRAGPVRLVGLGAR